MPPRQVVIAATPHVQSLDVTGPAEVFASAVGVAGAAGAYAVRLATPGGAPVVTTSGLRLAGDVPLERVPGPIDTLVVPGALPSGDDAAERALVRHVGALAERARRTVSVCTGVFVLAELGLLDGRTATTHWAACAELARRYPAIQVEPDRIFIHHGDVATSGGVTAGIDLALALVEEDLGAEVARTVARWLVLFLRRPGGQSQFSARLQLDVGGDGPLRRVVDEVIADPGGDHTVEQLARRAAVSTRHLNRLFAEEVGTSPSRFVERVRVEAARDLLEATTLPAGTIAHRCGFGTSETMRRAFLRVIGVGPLELRRRFGAVEGRAA